LNNLQWCQRVQDGSYQRERLGVKQTTPAAGEEA